MLHRTLLIALPQCGLLLRRNRPRSWIDPDTGHRVVRLTKEPGSASLYFNQNGYTADGKKLVYTTPDGISVLDLATQQARQVVEGRVRIDRRRPQDAARLSTSAMARPGGPTSIPARAAKIGDLPKRGSHLHRQCRRDAARRHLHRRRGPRLQQPASACRRAGQARRPQAQQQGHSLDQPRNKGQMMEERWAARLPDGPLHHERAVPAR